MGRDTATAKANLTAGPKIKGYKSSNLNRMQQLISWSKNLAVLHFKQEITEIIAILPLLSLYKQLPAL